MARQNRHTEPLETIHGTLTDYAEIDRHLVEGELRGRAWVLDRARLVHGTTPSDADILDLHRVMYGEFLPWAGQPRTDARGPSGVEWVKPPDIRIELRKLADDLRVWVSSLPSDPALADLARIVADAHHRFQMIHPFRDTNGRTGRVLDTYLLWVTFGLAGPDLPSSVIIEPFPDPAAEDNYYCGLQEADNGMPERLRAYYLARIKAAFVAPLLYLQYRSGLVQSGAVDDFRQATGVPTSDIRGDDRIPFGPWWSPTPITIHVTPGGLPPQGAAWPSAVGRLWATVSPIGDRYSRVFCIYAEWSGRAVKLLVPVNASAEDVAAAGEAFVALVQEGDEAFARLPADPRANVAPPGMALVTFEAEALRRIAEPPQTND